MYHQLLIIIIATITHRTCATFCSQDPCQNGGTCYTGLNSYVCVCPSRYSGSNCETFLDDSDYSITPCTSSTCSNGGICYTGPNGSFFCKCATGFRGTNCEITEDTGVTSTATPIVTHCTPTTCYNGGTCYVGASTNSFLCVCPSGYTGSRCNRVATTVPPYALVYCSSNPCNNGGTCYTGQSGYICRCPPGLTGQHCETPSLCGSNPCHNGGACFTGESSYRCVCPNNFTGPDCETPVVCSMSQPCLNGGSCDLMQIDGGLNATLCTCPEAYRGPYCETLASCIDIPCENGGTCIPAGGNSTDMICSCTRDFYGIRCQRQADICSSKSPCLNGGTCFTSSTNRTAYVCACPHGYEGHVCQHSNPCANNPCQNGGACSRPSDPTSDMVVCQCRNGFVGFRCEIEDTGIGACVTGACMNGGTCIPSPFAEGGLTCLCPASHTGSRCEQQIPLACGSNPCMNEATCNDVGDGNYQCTCLEGYTGRRCEVIGPCVSSPCMNGGLCVEDVYNPGNFVCHCRNQYTGTTCTIPPQEDPCNSSPCQNSGECVPTNNGTSYRCDCPADFVGVNCDIPDPCSPSPCLNSGVCNTIPVAGGTWGFYCVCTSQFLGLTCAVPRACVSNPCLNGGLCMDVLGSASQPIYGTELTTEMLDYNCRCTVGWTGQNCETAVTDPCQSNPCKNNGTCYRSHSTNRFFCSCLDGFYGPLCVADPCASNPCKNNATCQSVGNEYSCICDTGYSGDDCTVEDLCHSNPCANGGTCTLTDSWFECSCVQGYTGTDCSQDDPCFDSPCLNNGSCITVKRGAVNTVEYQCLCPLGFGGLTCGVHFGDPVGVTQGPDDPCDPEPCQNGGSCSRSSTTAGYICICPESFTGSNCENASTVAAPTAVEPTRPAPTGCTVGSRMYNNGESWLVGCQLCSCLGGMASCADWNCRDRCLHESRIYEPGTNRSDNCNSCTCVKGVWECTDNACGKTCTYMREVYLANEDRKEDCNMCSCIGGQWGCTTRACDAPPIVIEVSFEFINDISDIAGKEEQFISELRAALMQLLRIGDNHIQDMAIFPGSIKVKFNLVENKTDNVNIETVAVVLQSAISENSYIFMFEGQQYQSNPSSYRMVKQGAPTTAPPSEQPNRLLIIIIVSVCGGVGILIVIASVCYMVKRHTSRRNITEYGEDRLPSRSDKTSWGGIENEGYDRDRTTSRF
ncbi:fibropellin-1-like isoform X2 [Acanthaster planci]|uniref:Fibropellin-1-like isoform X2 n=1 Tax=Acanthaster planci TaxID=133434 RepID=A0A8B7XN47_ACAPL|nr:fibropellin-1-like isoform X2 [Acanthaster planci]